MEKVRLGIIGLGAQGSTYTRFISEGKVKNMVIGAFCDTDPAKGQKYAENYPNVPFYENYIDMLDSGNVDAIVTTAPHYLHPEIGIAALNRNVHPLVEKPAGVYTKQVKELNDVAATKPELTFAVFFNQRTNPLYQKVKEIIDNGEIGDIRRTNWIITTWWRPQGYYDQSDWRATWKGEGGGVLVNQAPHQLDLLQWIAGMPKKVFSNVKYGYKRDITVEDDVTALLDYGNGATGSFITATHDVLGTNRFEIFGDNGKILVEDSKSVKIKRLHQSEPEMNATISWADTKKLTKGKGPSEFYSEEVLEFESIWGEQHIAVLENFAANILDGTELIAPGSDGINGVALANAIHLSSWLGKEVELPVDEELFLAELNKKIEEEQGTLTSKIIKVMRRYFKVNKGKIAVQMMMLKEKVQELGVYETMKKLSEMGYHAVEVSQIPMTAENVAEFKRAMEDFHLEIAALSTKIEAKPGISEENLTDDFNEIVDDCKTLDCHFLRIGMLPLDLLGDKNRILQFSNKLENMAKKLDEYGIKLYYHTHHVEFQKYDGEFLLDIIKNNTTNLGFELDVHWTQRAGVNPVELLEQYAGRISLLHLKDYRVGDANLEGVKDRATYQQRFHHIIEFAEIGEGNLNMQAIIQAGLKHGATYFIIEQDNTYGRDPFESLKISADNLRNMGYADWF